MRQLANHLPAGLSRLVAPTQTLFRQVAYSVDLLLERRWWLYLIGDVFLLFFSMLEAIGSMSGSDWLEKLYPRVIVLPNLILGLPALARVISLERQVGSLDLALAVPSTERYFVRRVGPVCGLLIAQSWVVLFLIAEGWPLIRALVQATVLSVFLAALTLFWASRLRTSGAVLATCLVSVALMSPWIFVNPVTAPALGAPDELFGVSLANLGWLWNAAVMVIATTILSLYARERLRHPEAMLV